MKINIFLTIVLLVAAFPIMPSSEAKKEQTSQTALINSGESLVFLLLGIDSRDDDPVGRSDAIFLATVNPYKKSMMITIIPRDTYVEIPGKYKDKINHSYNIGGEKLTLKTVKEYLKLPIDGYLKMEMSSLAPVVDRIGGIEVNVPFSFTYQGCHFQKGRMKLNGKQALAFSRMRKKDPKGDLGRNQRQLEVMKAIIRRSASPYVMLHMIPIVKELRKKVKTNVPLFTMMQLIYTYHDVQMKQVVTNRLRGKGVLKNKIYYYIVKPNEVNRIRNAIMSYQRMGKPV